MTQSGPDIPDPYRAVASGTHDVMGRAETDVEYARALACARRQRWAPVHAPHMDHAVIPAYGVRGDRPG